MTDLGQLASSLKKELAEITEADMAAVLSEWRESGVTNRTLHRRFSSLRAFVAFLRETKPGQEDPTAKLELGADKPRLPKTLPVKSVRAILAAPDVATPEGLRDRALLELLYASGLRVSEAAGLKRAGLLPEQGLVKVFGKGAKERTIPVHEHAAEAVAAYIDEARPVLVRGRGAGARHRACRPSSPASPSRHARTSESRRRAARS